MTDKPTPTDAEIVQLSLEWPAETNDWASHIDFARAVLAKWGQPAQAAEPVAWLRNTTDPQPHAVTNLKYRSAVDAKAGVEYIPVFAAPQPVAREPLTDEQIHAIYDEVACREPYAGAVTRRNIVRAIEAAHGIKGGQQPTHAQAGAVPLDEARRMFDAGWKAAALFCDREDVVADGIIGFGASPQFEAAFSAANGLKGDQHGTE